ncbi:hypothetical protein K1719_011361 [Acacia pycnantha]|nr:hypothetical protein K1719_011361 [Acacia pycnantha]
MPRSYLLPYVNNSRYDALHFPSILQNERARMEQKLADQRVTRLGDKQKACIPFSLSIHSFECDWIFSFLFVQLYRSVSVFPPYGFHQSINFIFSGLTLQKLKEELHKRILDLQRKLDDKQDLESNIQQMRGALGVLQEMNHMGEDEDIKVEKEMDKIKEDLKDKGEELEAVEELQQTLIVKERKTNDELQDAGKELINVGIIFLTHGSVNGLAGVITL